MYLDLIFRRKTMSLIKFSARPAAPWFGDLDRWFADAFHAVTPTAWLNPCESGRFLNPYCPKTRS